MSAQDDLRMAWVAERAGRLGTRDVLLTLAIASSGPEDEWVTRAWSRLISARPDHFFAAFPSLSQALDNPDVVKSVNKLRLSFPPSRIERLLVRSAVSSGKYTGKVIPLDLVIDDLVGSRSLLRAKQARKRRTQTVDRVRSTRQETVNEIAIPTGLESVDREARQSSSSAIETLDLTIVVILVIILISSLRREDRTDSMAA